MEKKSISKAAALKYKPNQDAAPKVVASGQGKIAEKIIQIAKKYDIPIREDADLVELLMKVELDKEIPIELYQMVAEVLAFIYSLNRKYQSLQNNDN